MKEYGGGAQCNSVDKNDLKIFVSVEDMFISGVMSKSLS